MNNAMKNTIFIVTVFATFFNNALHWYTQVTTYPLFNLIGQQEFVPYHKAYERRLPFSIYIPYTLLMGSTLLLAFFRPAKVALAWVLALCGLNASVMAESLALAKPVHDRFDNEGKATEAGIRQLVRYNAVRLLASTISSGIVLYLLTKVIPVLSLEH